MKKSNYKKNIIIVTGSRSEYGYLKLLIKKLTLNNKINLHLVVTGSHLSSKHGLTIKELKNDGFNIFTKIRIHNKTDSKKDIINSLNSGISQFSNFLLKKKPDITILFGDRYEIFAFAIASYFNNIPIAHIGGGDTSEGSIDEGLRHSISKFSNYHFVSNKVSKKRLIQMGEDKNKIFNIGSLSLENINKQKLLSANQLQEKFKINFSEKKIMVCLHPSTINSKVTKIETDELIKALKKLNKFTIVITYPNSDMGHSYIIKEFIKFERNFDNAYLFKSLGQINYYSFLKNFDCIVGNSSSAIIEAPSFNIGIVNIGNRQNGRFKTKNVIDCKVNANEIKNSILKSFNMNNKLNNPYKKNNSAIKIIKELLKIKYPINLEKKFYDI